MKKEYDEIMERIEVTPEMRQRVLRHIQEENITPSSPKILWLPSLKRYLSVAACFVILVVGAITLPNLLNRRESEPSVLDGQGIEEVTSLQELSELVGFEVTTDFSLPFETQKAIYFSYWNELAEIEYSSGESFATYRQSLGTDDNSGDYKTYSDTIKLTVNDLNIMLKGSDGSYVLAVWTDGTYAYSLCLSRAMTVGEWETIFQG